MSRIGKQPVPLPAGVEASMSDRDLVIKGPKGTNQQWIDPRIDVTVDAEAKEVRFHRTGDEQESRALHGLYRALCNNMVNGVVNGFQKRLEVHGVGYQANLAGNVLNLNVGYSNTISLPVPEGVNVVCPNNTTIDVDGIDRQKVGQFAAQVRASRPSEPYKGKGIRYAGEQIRRKAGKSMAGGK